MTSLTGSNLWVTLVLETGRFLLRRHIPLFVVMAMSAILGATLLFAGIEYGESIVLGMAFYAPFIAGLVIMSGLVSDERASGFFLLWVQKPAWLSRSYAIRYALYLLLLALVAATLGSAIGALGVAGNLFTITKAFRLGAGMIPLALLPAAMVFAFSAWGVRRDAVFAFLTVVIGVSLAGITSFERSEASGLIQFLAFPLDPVMAIIGARSFPLDLTRAIAIICAQLAGWSLIGFLGLGFSERLLQRS
ncbi:MAG: hypothetical protein WEE89_01110 [Gemmatimonadota bacterium]